MTVDHYRNIEPLLRLSYDSQAREWLVIVRDAGAKYPATLRSFMPVGR